MYCFTYILFCSDAAEGAPSPKRSARRMCKESLKSTVLESAIARKEKSNYTEEHSQFKPIRKYNKPGRPKKILQSKDLSKQVHSKVSEIDNEADNTVAENNSYNEINTVQESSKNLFVNESSSSDLTTDNSQNSSTEFDGMPKLSPITKNSDLSQTKAGNNIKSTIVDDASMPDNEKSFLKPATGKTKRERGRPRGSLGARKIAKSDSLEGFKLNIPFLYYVKYK